MSGLSLSKNVFKKLRDILGEKNLKQNEETLVCYGYDASGRFFMPDAVAFPKNSEQIAKILYLANKENFFVIPRGAGSGMTGGSLPIKGGLVLSMSGMNKIINIDTNNLIAIAEPGVITSDFHNAVEKKGLFYPPDPSSSKFSTLGGNVAECAGGPRAVKYGVTKDYVLGLEAVLPTGEIIKTGVKTAKGVVGYDITKLITGSEGTLAVISKIILKLLPLPLFKKTITAFFDKIDYSAQTVSDIIKNGILPVKIEFMDNAAICCVENFLNIGLDKKAEALLLIEIDGNSKSEIEETIIKLEKIIKAGGANKIETPRIKEDEEKLWLARNSISPALFNYGSLKINEDIVVPRDKIPYAVKKIEELKRKTGLTMISFGHAGDGNIHFNIMINKDNEEEKKLAENAVDELFDYTLKLGGTISGEHGIGIAKSDYIHKEIGSVELNLMKNIKKLFDPNGILNPGKIFGAF